MASSLLLILAVMFAVFSDRHPHHYYTLGGIVLAEGTPTRTTSSSSYEDNECLPFGELTHIALTEQARHGFISDESYFCGSDPPAQFRCRCSASTVCTPFLSAEGRDFGICGCCTAWVWGILAILGIMGVSLIFFCFYLCCCRGQWWCDGYHPPVAPFLPRRGAPVVIPSSLPLPTGVFRGYRPQDFDSGLTAEDLARAREAQQRHRAAAQAAAAHQQQLREEMRRRRGQGAAAAEAPSPGDRGTDHHHESGANDDENNNHAAAAAGHTAGDQEPHEE